MTDPGARRGAANLGTLFMIVSFLVMIGFLVWLGSKAQETESVAIEEDTTEAADTTGEGAAVPVTVADLADGADGYVDQMIRLQNAPMSGPVGTWAFFVELGEQGQSNPFLVKLDSALIARGQSIPQGGDVTVIGTLHERTDSVTNQWIESGVVSESDRIIVEFATHYIEARRIQAGAGGAGGGGDGAAGGQGGAGGGGSGP